MQILQNTIESYSNIKKYIIHCKGKLLKNSIKSYWFIGTKNFGDLLNPILLSHYGFTPIHTTRQEAEILVIGSILDKVPEDYSGYIIGSGLLYDTKKNFPNARILALRGDLTRRRIGAPNNTFLGDPGLLITKLFKPKTKKKYTLGIIPHYIDTNDNRLKSIVSRYTNEVTIINVMRDPKIVINEIAQCEHIISSSLHGLISADSFGIPNAWIELSNSVKGQGFKFQDYASCFKMKLTPHSLLGNESLLDLLKLTHKVPNGILEIQEKLDNVFELFVTEFKEENINWKNY